MNIKKDANKREYAQADALGMTRCAGSGSFDHKGDLRDNFYLVDSKFTYNKSQITIKRKDLEKIDEEALNYCPPRKSAILLSINGVERVLIDVCDFNEYRELLRKEEENGKKV